MTEASLHHSCLKRQLAEVEVMRAMYPEEGEFSTTDAEAAALEMLDSVDENTPIPAFLFISFTLNLLVTRVGGGHTSVGFSFPRKYPESEAARVVVDCRGQISKHQHQVLNLGAQAAAREMEGNEAVFHVLQRVQELAWELQESDNSPLPDETSQRSEPEPCQRVHRKLLWFHHIKSSKKRKYILEWGAELKLGGYSKPGFPGVLICEGGAEDVAEYVERIQRLRWQAVQIRGEEEQVLTQDQTVDDVRRFASGIRELPESGMSELAGKCREANLEELFLTALKISK